MKIRLNKKDKCFEYNGEKYPPTVHNAQIFEKIIKDRKKEKQLSKQLSRVVLE